MRPHKAALLLLTASAACRCAGSVGTPDAGETSRPTTTARCPVTRPTLTDEVGVDLLERMHGAFQTAFEGGRYTEALACGQELARAVPDDPLGHLDRAAALEALEKPEEAHEAYERAVALDPDNPEPLRAEAEHLLRRGTDDALETAVLLARRGREHAEEAVEGAELAALEANALNALGRSEEALRAAETSLTLDDDNLDAQVERGIALFELLRFTDAREVLKEALEADAESPKATFYLGLLQERLGDEEAAKKQFSQAARLDPDAYPLPAAVEPPEFDALVKQVVAGLPAPEAAALAATEFSWAELPAIEDLQAGSPVLSPTIVGLFRPADEGRRPAILLYRRNLLRICRDRDELRREVRDTLLHELGHLDGADDAELRDRGL
jgi:tetratricopeptide (TPR) repeat protein